MCECVVALDDYLKRTRICLLDTNTLTITVLYNLLSYLITYEYLYLLSEPVPVSDRRVDNPFAIERPHAPADLIYRQCSFRGFDKLAASGSSPFKRQLSLPFSTARQTVVTSQLRSLQDKPSEFFGMSVLVTINLEIEAGSQIQGRYGIDLCAFM